MSHWFEYSFGNLGPLFLATKILGNKAHFATGITWFIFMVYEFFGEHSGYDLPLGLPSVIINFLF